MYKVYFDIRAKPEYTILIQLGKTLWFKLSYTKRNKNEWSQKLQ